MCGWTGPRSNAPDRDSACNHVWMDWATFQCPLTLIQPATMWMDWATFRCSSSVEVRCIFPVSPNLCNSVLNVSLQFVLVLSWILEPPGVVLALVCAGGPSISHNQASQSCFSECLFYPFLASFLTTSFVTLCASLQSTVSSVHSCSCVNYFVCHFQVQQVWDLCCRVARAEKGSCYSICAIYWRRSCLWQHQEWVCFCCLMSWLWSVIIFTNWLRWVVLGVKSCCIVCKFLLRFP